MLYLDGKLVNTTLFPDNTSQVWKVDIPRATNLTVEWKYSNEGEFMQLAQLKALLDVYDRRVNLYLPYLPYGRQDKEVCNNATFGLTTFAHHLNELNFANVKIRDPHSGLALNLIKRSTAAYPTIAVNAAYKTCTSSIVCYPDNGAFVKYTELYPFADCFAVDKVRDPLTGHIKSISVPDVCRDRNVLIVDDICDGGATFQGIAQELLRQQAGHIDLFVTHGIFSKGVRHLFSSGIRRIFTADGEIFAKDFQ
jgi:ribose-phosphate pyrophosphokinase